MAFRNYPAGRPLLAATVLLFARAATGVPATQLPAADERAQTARRLLGEGRAEEAERIFRDLLRLEPDSVVAALGVGRALQARGSAEEALRLWLEWGEQRIAGDGYAAAAVVLEEATTAFPESPAAFSALGRALYLDRRYLAAEEPLVRAMQMGDRSARTLYYLASTLWENNDAVRAEQVLRQSLARHPEHPSLLHQLGRLLLWQGRFAEAAALLDRVARLQPVAADVWIDLATALEGADELQPALAAYQRAVELAPDHYQARYGWARLLRRVGESEAARGQLEVYQRLLAEDQHRVSESGLEQARLAHGRELVEQGELAAALAHLESLPVSPAVLAALAEVHRRRGDADAELSTLERAVARFPERQDLRARLAEARLARGAKP